MDKQLKNILKSLKLNENTISTFLGAAVVFVIGLLVFNYFKSFNTTKGQITPQAITETATPGKVEFTEDADGVKVPKGLPTTYTVVKGDHLWGIAEKYYQSGYNWVDIASANQLTDADGIEVGQKLTIPKVGAKLATIDTAIDTKTDSTSIDSSTYTVVAGDHLWGIAVRAYGDGFAWVKIYTANKDKIGLNPGLIEVGQVLTLPR